MTRSTKAVRLILLAAACCVGLLIPASSASAKRYSFTAARQHGNVVSFRLHGLRSATIFRAELRVRHYRRKISVRRVWRGVRRGSLRLRVPRRVARLQARASRRAKKPRLIVVTTTTTPTTDPSTGTGSTSGSTTTSGGSTSTTSPGTVSTLLAPKAPILTDADAAGHVRRSPWEPRPQNAGANNRVPTSAELQSWRSQSNYAGVSNGPYYLSKVTGNFTGTTDEILQWAAWKWGFNEDILRAQAVNESSWYQSAVGDSGISYGILQLKSTIQKGTFPLSRDSTPFNVDYAMMTLRHCYDGYATWLGNGYQAGDFWGCIGYYYSGLWYDAGATAYIDHVKSHLLARDWAQPGF